jgi:ribosome biogenesis GTPase A
VAVIGYPNVGKSAIINKLIGRKLAKSKNMPGVTKRIQWVRLGAAAMGNARKEDELELLDSPGIIPAKQVNQETALKLAVCNDIGQASYDVQVVAAELVAMLKATAAAKPGYVDLDKVAQRYQLDVRAMTGDEFLHALAAKLYRGNLYSAADRLMGDFRRGLLGAVTLELPPPAPQEEGEGEGEGGRVVAPGAEARAEEEAEAERRRRLEEEEAKDANSRVKVGEGDSIAIGRGQFEGW